MADEKQPQSTPPNSLHLADNPHPRSALERMLRVALRLRRVKTYLAYVAEELYAARAEINAARAELPTEEARAHASRLMEQCSERFRDALAQSEAFARYAKRAEDMAATARGVTPLQSVADLPPGLAAQATLGKMSLRVVKEGGTP